LTKVGFIRNFWPKRFHEIYSSRSGPIVLFSKENNNVALGIDKELPPFPTLPNLVSGEQHQPCFKNSTFVGSLFI
jgi:hypothetical protein